MMAILVLGIKTEEADIPIPLFMTGCPANVQYVVVPYRIRAVVEDESATYKFYASEIKAAENDVLSPDSEATALSLVSILVVYSFEVDKVRSRISYIYSANSAAL